MNETIVVEDGQAAVATTSVSGTLSPESSATDTIAIVDTPSGKQAAVVTTSVSGTLSPESSATDTIAIVDTPSGKQAALKVYNLNGGGGGGGATINNQDITVTKNGTYTANEGYTGLGKVEVQVPNPSTGTLSIVENGSYDVTEYATAEVNVPTGGGATTKYGVSIDNMLGNVDAEGNYVAPTEEFTVNLSGVKSIGKRALDYRFYGMPVVGHLDASAIVSIDGYGMYNTFASCEGITSADFSSLEMLGDNSMGSVLNSAGIAVLSFPKLTKVVSTSFGSTISGAFSKNVVELHFRADTQANIESMTGYSKKFGASNATIYFDLIGTITVNGVAYSRDEPNSIRVDGTKTFVAWKDAGGNIVYTAATAEPAVGTPVYSDAGTTQVGTVSEVA